MSHKFKGLHKGIFFFILIILPWSSTYSAEIGEEIAILQFNVTEAKLGEYCWVKICQANQFCDTNFVCRCLPGYKVYNNDCMLFSGENEKCLRQEDCDGKLICINGICRKPRFNDEFATLAKVCLGITITTIIIAVFSSLIKCLIKHDDSQAFRRESNTSRVNFTPAFNGNACSPGPSLYEVQEEKPPSYEECIRSSEPPPYVISGNPPFAVESLIQPINLTSVNPQNEIPLNIKNLSPKINLV